MKKLILLFGIIILYTSCSNSQNTNESNFEFPKSDLGDFAKIWFDYVNAENAEYPLKYDKNKEWEDEFLMLRGISQRKNGTIPYLVSYETEDFISIYSKQNKGSWIKVNLGLNSYNEITAMGLRRTFKPIDYTLRNNLTKKEVNGIVNMVSENLRTNYVIEKSRLVFSSELIQLLNSGKYNSITQGDLLAEVLTKDLIKISNDKHLQVIPPSRISEVEKRFGTDDENQKSASKNSAPTNHSSLEEGNVSSKLLDNNIGYIAFKRFDDNEKTIIATENIFQSMVDTKAIIIDLRYSGGGDAGAVVDLMSYFVTKDELSESFPELIKNKEFQNGSDRDKLSSMFLEKPLYVLTSNKTISAGEAFVYYLQDKNRATIIGEKTAGAGYRVDIFELPYSFFFVNSIFTTFDTEKGEGWQGTGIKPDISTSSSKALDAALSKIRIN